MATEDHDFEEINHINIFKKTFRWMTNQKGAVGRMSLNGIDSVFKRFTRNFIRRKTFQEFE